MRRALLMPLGLIVACLGAGACKKPEPPPADGEFHRPIPRTLTESLGAEDPVGLDVLHGFDRADIFLIGMAYIPEAVGKPPFMDGSAVEESARQPLDAQGLAELKTLLADPKALDTQAEPNACIFIPYVGLVLWKGESSVELALCFRCKEFTLTSSRITAVPKANPSIIRSVGGSIRESAGQLAQLSVAKFPDDKALKAVIAENHWSR